MYKRASRRAGKWPPTGTLVVREVEELIYHWPVFGLHSGIVLTVQLAQTALYLNTRFRNVESEEADRDLEMRLDTVEK